MGGWNRRHIPVNHKNHHLYGCQQQVERKDFSGYAPHFRGSMRFLFMKEDLGYEEFLGMVYEAETEGSEGKVLNVKAKAMTIEKITDNKEQDELKNLKQQIESLPTIMKSATVGDVKPKVIEGVSSPRKTEVLGNSPQKGFQGSPKKGEKDL